MDQSRKSECVSTITTLKRGCSELGVLRELQSLSEYTADQSLC